MRVIALAVILLVAQTAAQAPFPGPPFVPTKVDVIIAEPTTLIRPLGPFVALDLTVRYTFTEVNPPTTDPTSIYLTTSDVPTFLTATVSPSQVYAAPSSPPCLCERTIEVASYLLVSAGGGAPALERSSLMVDVAASPNGPYEASQGQSPAEVTTGALVRIQLGANMRHLRMGSNSSMDVPLAVTNQGNGAVSVAFRLRDAPLGLNVSLPPPIEVGAVRDGSVDTVQTVLRVQTGEPVASGLFHVVAEARSIGDADAEPHAIEVAFAISAPVAPASDMSPRLAPAPPMAAGLGIAIGVLLCARSLKIRNR